MAGDDLVGKLLAEQRRRLIATLLGTAESAPWWRDLTAEQQRAHRDKVLSSVGVFYDFCRDVVKVSSEDMTRNEYALELLQAVHDGQAALVRRLTVAERA